MARENVDADSGQRAGEPAVAIRTRPGPVSYRGVALSGYHSALYDELYRGWFVTESLSKMAHSVKTERTEVLWTNYDPQLPTLKAKEVTWNQAKSSRPLFETP